MGKSPIASLCAFVAFGAITAPLLAGCGTAGPATGATMKQVAELKGSDTVGGEEFGTSVAVSGTTAVAGISTGTYAGRAYVFTKTRSGWEQVAEFEGFRQHNRRPLR